MDYAKYLMSWERIFFRTSGAFAFEVRAFNQFQKSFQQHAVAPGTARRAQRPGRAHLRVPVDEMIFEIAKRPAGQISLRTAFLVTFVAVDKSDSYSQGLASKNGMDAKR